MPALRILLVVPLLLTLGCAGGSSSSTPRSDAPSTSPATSQAPSADTSGPLGEFEPLSQADVELYLKVMREAAARLQHLSDTDRAALKTFRAMTTGQPSNQVPTPELMAAMQRAGELMALDSVVAREMGVARRYSSISGRVPKYGMPEMTGEGDDPMTPEQRAALKVRIEKFQQRKQQDAAMFQPHRQEIEALQKQVDLITHPESIPR